MSGTRSRRASVSSNSTRTTALELKEEDGPYSGKIKPVKNQDPDAPMVTQIKIMATLMRLDRDLEEMADIVVSTSVPYAVMHERLLKAFDYIGEVNITFLDEVGDHIRLTKRNYRKVVDGLVYNGIQLLQLKLIEPADAKERNIEARNEAMTKWIAETAGAGKMNEAWCWGGNTFGQLGVGSRVPSWEVAAENERVKKDVPVQVACGAYFTVCLTEDRSVFAWGEGSNGQLGLFDGGVSNSVEQLTTNLIEVRNPKKVHFFDGLEIDNQVWHIACGSSHCAALTMMGQVYCWGAEYGGTEYGFDMLGLDLASKVDYCHYRKSVKDASIPRRVMGLKDSFIMQIACGGLHTACIDEFGELFTWGLNGRGQLGQGDNQDRPSPMSVKALYSKSVIKVECGHQHTIVLLNNHDVASWGAGDRGQLGHGNKDDQLWPTVIDGLTDEGVHAIACGHQHSAAVARKGQNDQMDCLVYTWGEGDFFRLGHGDETDCVVPRVVDELSKDEVRELALGQSHSVALSTSERVYTWGDSSQGQCGQTNLTKVELLPKNVDKCEGQQIRQISAGAYHTFGLTCRRPDPPEPPSKAWECPIM